MFSSNICPSPAVSVASKKRKKKRRRKRKPTEEGELAAKSRGSKFTGALAEHLLKLAPDAHRKRKRDDGDCSPNKRMRSESGEPLENDAQSSGESALGAALSLNLFCWPRVTYVIYSHEHV